MPPFIEIRGLEHVYPLGGGEEVTALRGIDLTIERGEFVAIVGPNGSGKSTLVRHFNALLLPTAGQVWVDGLLTADPRNLWAVRRRVGMVFQNPDNQIVASTVEEDVAFGPENMALPSAEIRRRVDEALETVGLADYRFHPPHLLSGGQRQLLAIAGVLATRPAGIVFDEPASMLDPLSRRQVLATIRRLHQDGLTVVLITQAMDEAVSAQRVLVMDGGRIVMDGPPAEVFEQGKRLRELGLDLPPAVEIAHGLRERGLRLPSGLLTVEQLAENVARAFRPVQRGRKWCHTDAQPYTNSGTTGKGAMLIQVRALSHTYAAGTPLARPALHEVSLEIAPGERVGLVGRTGAGKSTLAQLVAGLLTPTAGQVLLDGVPAHERSAARAVRSRVALAFQYPEHQFFEQTVAREIAFGPRNLGLSKDEIGARVRWALEMVGLDRTMESRSPFTLSGGEMRRVALASILALRPEVLILDEPTAGLDPRGRRELLARVRTWQEETGATLIVISHDLEELAHVVERVIVLYEGRIVADGSGRQVLSDGAALAAAGLDMPQPVALLRALRASGWNVRTDRLLAEEAVEEIANACSH